MPPVVSHPTSHPIRASTHAVRRPSMPTRQIANLPVSSFKEKSTIYPCRCPSIRSHQDQKAMPNVVHPIHPFINQCIIMSSSYGTTATTTTSIDQVKSWFTSAASGRTAAPLQAWINAATAGQDETQRAAAVVAAGKEGALKALENIGL